MLHNELYSVSKDIETSQSLRRKKQLKSDLDNISKDMSDNNDFQSYVNKNIHSKQRYREPKQRYNCSDTALINKCNIKRKRVNIIEDKFMKQYNSIVISDTSSDDNSDDDLYSPYKIYSINHSSKMIKATSNKIRFELETEKKISSKIQESSSFSQPNSSMSYSKRNKMKEKYNWIMELKDIDKSNNLNNCYKNNYLILLRNFPSYMLRLSFNEFNTMNIQTVEKLFNISVVFIPRCRDGQMYYANLLRCSEHFTLSIESSNMLKHVLNKLNIKIINIEDEMNVNGITFYNFGNLRNLEIRDQFNKLMSSIGNSGLWSHFISLKKKHTHNKELIL